MVARSKIAFGMVVSVAAIAALQAAPALPQTTVQRDEATCKGLSGIQVALSGESVKLISATHIAAYDGGGLDPRGQILPALPSHCHVEGVVGERKGAGGKDFGIRFEINLPDRWSGRFLLQGGGGLNGAVWPATGQVASDGVPALARGFAVISSDSGHQGAVFDASFMADQRAALDFAEASVRTVTLLGKQMTQAYYGQPIAHSYMTGCSTGGREAMLASQRYPELFDGIIAGAPAMRTGDSNLAIEYTQVLMNQAAPLDSQGKPDLGQLLSPAVRKTLLDGVLAQCDTLDGLKDGMIENVAGCNFQPKKLECRPGQSDGCLSRSLTQALEAAFRGPYDKAGFPIYTPVPFDTGIVKLNGGYLPTGAPGPLGPANLSTTIDLDARAHAIRQNASQRLTDTNYWTNLNTYLDRGSKILFFHGVSDFWFSPFATSDYYQRASAANGPAFEAASRLYMVPGMMHCQGGNAFDGFDMLSSLVAWVEKGEAPHAITAHRSGNADETRPLCPYPAYAEYIGGDPKKAASFACKTAD